jgi:integrase
MRVRVESDRGILRLRWTIDGKRFGFSLGLPDQPVYRALAKQKAALIEQDWYLGTYDPSLRKYHPQGGGGAAQVSCPELFEEFTDSKNLSEGSLTKYRSLLRHLRRCLNKPAADVTPGDALNFRAALLERVSERTAREYLWLIGAAFDWGEERFSLPGKNLFSGISKTIKPPPRAKVECFSAAEIRLILQGFQSDPVYSFYYDLVLFLFSTGCRPGEAFGLRWRNVSEDFRQVTIREGAAKGRPRTTTKTGFARVVYLGDATTAMFRDRHSRFNATPDDRVFPAPRGGIISDHTFRRRAWKTVLETVGVPYRKPYAMRHSAASFAFERGENPAAIAEQLGHSLEIFLSTYVHSTDSRNVFQEF